MARGDGVEARENSIRLFFVLEDGERRRETLMMAGKALKPTPANLKYAARVSAEIRGKIRHGTFEMADYFPESKHAAKVGKASTFGDMCDVWMETKGRLASKTLKQYRNALGVWRGMLGENTPMVRLTHATLAAKVGGYPWASAKLLNNYLIPLRGVFALAGREMKLDNPMRGIENSKHQAPAPDPLSLSEMETILADIRERCDLRIWAYFEFAFMTGMRPEELIALHWGDVDWNHRTIRVERARTSGEEKPLKTYSARDVDLVDRALEALKAMKPSTYMGGVEGCIFQNPNTLRPFHDERSQREQYWNPSLRRLGIRRRRAYQTRHTYAANALSAGVNPAYIARQMGHKNAKMLFQVYAKWIDGADRGRERAKMEAALNAGQVTRTKIRKTAKPG
ncbi:MAG: tyrosine-type recombinase/integrase [Xylophilus ampelinus]